MILLLAVLLSCVGAERCPMPYHCEKSGFCICNKGEYPSWSYKEKVCECRNPSTYPKVTHTHCTSPLSCFDMNMGCQCVLPDVNLNPLLTYYFSNCSYYYGYIDYKVRCTPGVTKPNKDGLIVCSLYRGPVDLSCSLLDKIEANNTAYNRRVSIYILVMCVISHLIKIESK